MSCLVPVSKHVSALDLIGWVLELFSSALDCPWWIAGMQGRSSQSCASSYMPAFQRREFFLGVRG